MTIESHRGGPNDEQAIAFWNDVGNYFDADVSGLPKSNKVTIGHKGVVYASLDRAELLQIWTRAGLAAADTANCTITKLCRLREAATNEATKSQFFQAILNVPVMTNVDFKNPDGTPWSLTPEKSVHEDIDAYLSGAGESNE